MTVPRGMTVVPNVMRTRFRYCVTYRTDAVGTALGTNSVLYQFAGNGMFNPDLNVILENYPMGLPEMSRLYGRYNVSASTIKVQIGTTQNISLTSVRMIIWPHQYTQSVPSGAQTVDDFVGQPNAGKIVEIGPVSGNSHGVSLQSRRTSYMLSRPEVQIFCAPDTSAIITNANPTTLWYWNVIITRNDIIVGRPAVDANFEITYEANLFEQEIYEPTNNARRIRTVERSESIDIVEVKEDDDLASSGAAAQPT